MQPFNMNARLRAKYREQPAVEQHKATPRTGPHCCCDHRAGHCCAKGGNRRRSR